MTTISNLLSRDISEPIEEVIKLEQQDEATVYREISEYVATDRIKRQYLQVLKAIADAPCEPTEGVGVLVSGFFGSGKSSFAKNLGYVLANRPILGQPASQVFVNTLRGQAAKQAETEIVGGGNHQLVRRRPARSAVPESRHCVGRERPDAVVPVHDDDLHRAGASDGKEEKLDYDKHGKRASYVVEPFPGTRFRHQ